MQFTCTCCGQVHEGLADLVFELEESEHRLSVERRQGISVGRLQKIHEANLHSAG